MARFNVYGVCDWPEEMGETFVIFVAKEFPDADAAAAAAHAAFSPSLEVQAVPVKCFTTEPEEQVG